MASVLTPQSATAEALRDLQNSNPIRNSRMERQEAHRNYYYYFIFIFVIIIITPPKRKEKKSSTHAQVKTTRVESGTKPEKRNTPKGLQEIPVQKQKPNRRRTVEEEVGIGGKEPAERGRKKEVRVTTGSSNGAT